jgi:conjugative relaxase-like TrwC/TraI family protein
MGIATISKIDDASYYENYAAAARVGGWWIGSAVEAELGIDPASPVQITVLGEDGKAEQTGDLTRLLEGKHPRTGEDLPLVQRQRGRREGFDITFSPPKSVSILGLLSGDQAVEDATWRAHRAAVKTTMAWFERELAVGRRGHGGRDGVVHGTIAAVGWDHATSREDDPQMHTHVSISNLIWAVDGKLSSLDGDRFFAGKHAREQIVKVLSNVYGSEMRREMTEELGVGWTKPQGRDGHREIAGVPSKLIREFSRGRRRVLAATEAAGLGDDASGKARQAAEMASRSAKGEKLASELMPEWQARMEALYVRPIDIVRSVAKQRTKHKGPMKMPEVPDVMRALHGAGGKPTWTRHDLVGALCLLTPLGIDPATAEQWADDVLSSDDVLTASEPIAPKSEYATHGTGQAARFTWRALWEAESAVVEMAKTTERAGIDPAVVEQTIAASTLDDEQATLVRAVTGDGFCHLISARAGTGKTYALGEAAKAWAEDGREAVGITNAWRAANELSDVGIESEPFAKIAMRAQFQGVEIEDLLPAGGVVVVDETSQMPSLDLAQLVGAAQRAECQVVLCGDPRQLGSVEAGGLFAMLASDDNTVELVINRRQIEPWRVQMIEDIRSGRGARAVDALYDNGDIVLTETPEDAATQLLADWAEARASGAEVAILSGTVAGRETLNALAHAHLVASGEVSENGIVLAETHEHNGLPEREVAGGDEVRFRKQRQFSSQVKVVNGDGGIVEHADAKHITVRLADGHIVKMTTDWAGEHVDLGYASTVHAAQGQTVGTARAARERGADARRGETFILDPESAGLELAHVAQSRATDRTRVYSAVEIDPKQDSHWLDRDGNPIAPGEADRLKQMQNRWANPDDAAAALAERARHERIAERMQEPRENLEAKRDALSELARAGRAGDLRGAVSEDRGKLDPDDPATQRRHDELVRLAWKHRNDSSDLAAERAELDELDDTLHYQRRAAVEGEVLAAAIQPDSSWVAKALGPIPPDRAGQIRYHEAAGNLVDAGHYVAQARLASGSQRINNLAKPEIVHQDLVPIVRAEDRRPLEELAGDEDVETGRQAVETVDPELHEAVETPVSERLLRAAAVLEVDPTEAIPETHRMIDQAKIPPKPAWNTALRVRLEAEVAARDRAGDETPAAVRIAVLPGGTTNAVRAILAAGEIADELRPPVVEPVQAPVDEADEAQIEPEPIQQAQRRVEPELEQQVEIDDDRGMEMTL